MSLKDFQAHSIGRRHQLALSKVDTNLEKLPSSSHTTPAGVGGKNIQRGGLVRSGQPAPTAMHPASLDVHASATPPVSSRASETVKQSTSSTSSTKTVKQMTNKAKKSTKVKRPKKERESIATPTASARLKILGLNDEYLGDRQDNSNPNHSMCGQECGWCGQYMNHLTDAYVLICILLTLSRYLTLCSERGERNEAKTSSVSLRLILSQPAPGPLPSRQVLLRRRGTRLRISSHYMLPFNTTGELHRMKSLNGYVLSLPGHHTT